MSKDIAERVEAVFAPLRAAADRGYIGEPVSQLEHALQAAALGSRARAAEHEILAALLHDIGHLIAPDSAPQMDGLGVVDHEHLGAAFLGALGVDASVCMLVASHVTAKRYLALRKPGYYAALSSASRGTLAFQGGPMSEAEADAFEADPQFAAKLRLRAWDEAAKRTDVSVPTLDSYAALLREHME
ncbi:MAG: HD domain-containing protein [Polyangiales bacterium]